MPCTLFADVHHPEDKSDTFIQCYIEAPAEEAITIFARKFGHNPMRIKNGAQAYIYQEYANLEEATRGWRMHYKLGKWTWEEIKTVEEYLEEAGSDVVVVREAEIKSEWRRGGFVPTSYVWSDEVER